MILFERKKRIAAVALLRDQRQHRRHVVRSGRLRRRPCQSCSQSKSPANSIKYPIDIQVRSVLILWLHWNCTETALKLLASGTENGTALELLQNRSKLIIWLHWNCSETALILSLGAAETRADVVGRHGRPCHHPRRGVETSHRQQPTLQRVAEATVDAGWPAGAGRSWKRREETPPAGRSQPSRLPQAARPFQLHHGDAQPPLGAHVHYKVHQFHSVIPQNPSISTKKLFYNCRNPGNCSKIPKEFLKILNLFLQNRHTSSKNPSKRLRIPLNLLENSFSTVKIRKIPLQTT